MMNIKEISFIVLVSIVLAFAITLLSSLNSFFYFFLIVLILILINVLAKKITAFFLESKIEVKLWEVSRYGFKPSSSFNKPVPAGVIAPLVIAFITLGRIYWLASLVFEVKVKTSRAAKKWGTYAFSEMTEGHIGIIAGAGILATLVFALIGYLLGFEDFARISIFFAFFNMLPISDLDGNKIFFGSIVFWSFLAALTLIGLGYAFLLV
jgi:Zn-dependent protease